MNYVKCFGDEFKKSFKSLFKKGERIKQIPNVLTFSRALAPLFVVPVALTGNLIMALILTVLFASTDAIDGLLARKLDAVSEFGKDLDPFCDKIFTAGLSFPIVAIYPVILVPLAFETVIGTTNVISKAKGNSPKTTFMGKLKTFVGAILLITLYATTSYVVNPTIVLGLFTATIALQAYVMFDYIKIHLKKELVKKSVTPIIVNREKNPEVEKIKERGHRKKVKTLGEIDKGIDLSNNLSEKDKCNAADYRKLKDEVVGIRVDEPEKEKQLTIGVIPETKRNL